MNDYSIVTVCSKIPVEPYYCLNEFIKSLRDETLLALGTYPNSYSGLGSKPKLLYYAIKNNDIKSKYIIFCDCFDLVFACAPKGLLSAYLNCYDNVPLVISSERNCFPIDLKDEYDKLAYTSSYRYLNSGMIVGETEALLTALEAMDLANVPDDYRMENGQNFHVNDQFLWQQIFLKQPVKMELDYQQILCNTLHSVTLDDLKFIEGTDLIENKETKIYPCAFHMNGSAKTDGLREPILKHLNL